MANKNADIMREDALYVTFITVLSVALLVLGMNMGFQG